jgi:hypothetical protein
MPFDDFFLDFLWLKEGWHIRYIDDPKKAEEITESGISLEEYLAR